MLFGKAQRLRLAAHFGSMQLQIEERFVRQRSRFQFSEKKVLRRLVTESIITMSPLLSNSNDFVGMFVCFFTASNISLHNMTDECRAFSFNSILISDSIELC